MRDQGFNKTNNKITVGQKLTMAWIKELVGRDNLSIHLKNELLLLSAPAYAELLPQMRENEWENVELIDTLACPLRNFFVSNFDRSDFVSSVVGCDHVDFLSIDEDKPAHSTREVSVRR